MSKWIHCNAAVYNKSEADYHDSLGISIDVEYRSSRISVRAEDISACREEVEPDDKFPTCVYLKSGELFYVDIAYDDLVKML